MNEVHIERWMKYRRGQYLTNKNLRNTSYSARKQVLENIRGTTSLAGFFQCLRHIDRTAATEELQPRNNRTKSNVIYKDVLLNLQSPIIIAPYGTSHFPIREFEPQSVAGSRPEEGNKERPEQGSRLTENSEAVDVMG